MNIQEDRLEDIWCEECHTTEGGTFLKAGKRLCELCHGKDVSDDSVLAFAIRTGDEELIGILEAVAKKGVTNPDYWNYQRYEMAPTTRTGGLVILPTCYGCGMIAGVSCSSGNQVGGKDFNQCGDPLVDFDEYHQFTIGFPVVTEGRGYGKSKQKQVTFNSIRCANLALMLLVQKESKTKIMSYVGAQTLGQYRYEQGYRRCPCGTVNKNADFCNTTCEEKFKSQVNTIEEVAGVLNPEEGFRGRCANKNCGTGRDARGNRVRARVPNIGDFCSKPCRKAVKEMTVQKAKYAATRPPASEVAHGTGTVTA